MFAIADTLDALTTDRPYRPASTLAQARAMIEEEVGTHFDPAVAEAFARLPDEAFEEIRREIG